MSGPVLSPLSLAGRESSSADLEPIRRITSDFAGLGITAVTIWDIGCRSALAWKMAPGDAWIGWSDRAWARQP